MKVMFNASWTELAMHSSPFPGYFNQKCSLHSSQLELRIECLQMPLVMQPIHSASPGALWIKVTAHTYNWKSGLGSLIMRSWYASVETLHSRMCMHQRIKRGLCACTHTGMWAFTGLHGRTLSASTHVHTSVLKLLVWVSSDPKSHLLELLPHAAGCWAATWHSTAQHGST